MNNCSKASCYLDNCRRQDASYYSYNGRQYHGFLPPLYGEGIHQRLTPNCGKNWACKSACFPFRTRNKNMKGSGVAEASYETKRQSKNSICRIGKALCKEFPKKVGKLGRAMRAKRFPLRTFGPMASYILYAIKSTWPNPANFFYLKKAHQSV